MEDKERGENMDEREKTEEEKLEAMIKKMIKDDPLMHSDLHDCGAILVIESVSEIAKCPICGAPAKGNLIWKCCNSSIEKSAELARRIFKVKMHAHLKRFGLQCIEQSKMEENLRSLINEVIEEV